MSNNEKEKLTEEKLEETEETVKEEKEKKKKTKKKTEVELLQDENEKLKEEVEELGSKALRAIAELENYKKRTEKAFVENIEYYNRNLIEKLLIPLEQLSLAVNANVESDELRNWLVGFKMINNLIFEVLEEEGLKEVKSNGEKFDPKYHDAVEKTTDLEQEDGVILETIKTGYILNDKVIRAAQVIVNDRSDENEKDK